MKWCKSLSVTATPALVFAALASVARAEPIPINFGIGFVGGAPSFTPGSTPGLQNSTAFDFGGGLYTVTTIGPGDQSGLTQFTVPGFIAGESNTVTLPNQVSYGPGDSGPTEMSKSWTSPLGSFNETFTSFTADRNTANAIALTFSGELTEGDITEPAFLILSANQVGGPGTAVSWTATNVSNLESLPTTPEIPLPGAIYLFGTGLAGLGFLNRRRRKNMSALPLRMCLS